MRVAIIEDGKCTNIIMAELSEVPDGIEFNPDFGVGDLYVNGVWSKYRDTPEYLAERKSAKQTANKAACTAFILQHYPEPIQRSAALGVYPSEISTAMTDHIVDIIAEENRVFDLLEAATTIEELNAVENPTWPEV